MTTPSVDVWWADLTAADLALLPDLPEAERRRVLAVPQDADRGRSLVAAALLQHAVATHRGRAQGPPTAGTSTGAPVEVDRTCADCGEQHGRPVVDGGPHLSVAHAGLLVVVATCADAPVGVDVERLGRDLPHGTDAQGWTLREARTKAGAGPRVGTGETVLTPPMPGYAAALVVAPVAGRPGAGVGVPDVHEHRWRPDRGAAPRGVRG
ncbi:4'-phosphopantetheinyl transferase family protein [Serinicoccus chungangensis]|uniref:4'-phosphopantetheinyl transferase family protein n=1 Tax=Serinicoccus chungangensis TaxID=767452 RepID=UPI001118E16B|nr:hypothetical protein [Serinicoccus chungangensis]